MTTLREAAQQALETLEYAEANHGGDDCYADSITALRAALAEPAREPAYKVKITGRWHDAEPFAAAFSLPDGEHLLYTAPPQRPAEPVQEPAAIVGTQEDVWKGYEGQWAPPGSPIKTVHMLRELPVGTLLYTSPPQRKPLTDEEIERLWYPSAVIAEPGKRRVAFGRAIERAHGIGGEE